jgi:hypothetical protein
MASLTVCTWLWGTGKYTSVYVERLHAGLRKHMREPFRFLLMTERERVIDLPEGIERHAIKDPQLTEIKGCFARLRMFDPGWQKNRDIRGRVLCLDLDVVITRSLAGLFDRLESIVLLSGANSINPCPYNNSVFMFQAGKHTDLWSDFSLDAVAGINKFVFPDDQGWFWHKLGNHAPKWQAGSKSGIYAFRKPGWPPGDRLPSDAKIVAFPGHRDPAQFTNLPWVKEHWSNVRIGN